MSECNSENCPARDLGERLVSIETKLDCMGEYGNEIKNMQIEFAAIREARSILTWVAGIISTVAAGLILWKIQK